MIHNKIRKFLCTFGKRVFSSFSTLLVIIVVILSACDDRHDYFEKEGFLPIVQVYKGYELNTTLSDSLKVNRSATYSFIVDCKDDVLLSYDVERGDYTVSISNNSVTVTSHAVGSGEVDVVATSDKHKTGSCALEFITFENMPPVCRATVELVDTVLKVIEVDAGASFDKDSKYGGKITLYEFKIDGLETITTPQAAIKQLLKKAGTRTIRARCKDDDNEWSEEVELKINI